MANTMLEKLISERDTAAAEARIRLFASPANPKTAN
jgi:hypothetical protein